jgi:hypothetical protein
MRKINHPRSAALSLHGADWTLTENRNQKPFNPISRLGGGLNWLKSSKISREASEIQKICD